MKNLRGDSMDIASLQSNVNPVTDFFDAAEQVNQQYLLMNLQPIYQIKALVFIQLCQTSVSLSKEWNSQPA